MEKKSKKRRISVQSGKQKGRRLQQDVRDRVLELFKEELEPDDVRSTGMGQSGTDLQLSPLAKRKFPFALEAKNQEALSIWACLEQAEANSDNLIPLLVFKRNRSKTYACLNVDDFFKILEELYEYRKDEKTLLKG